MALQISPTVLRIATVVVCLVLFILAFVIIISLAESSKEAGGECLLYTTRLRTGYKAVCEYVFAVTAIFHFFFCLPRAVILIVVLIGKLKEEIVSTTVVLLVCTCVDAVGFLLTLVSGGMVSHGFSTLCYELFKSEKCGPVPFYIEATSSLVTDYHNKLNITQGSVWFSLFVWILLLVVDVLVLHRAGILQKLLLRFRRGGRNTSNNAQRVGGISRDRSTNSSVRSGIMLLFKRGAGGEDSDADSGPRTPPPRRPPPPKPAAAPGASLDRGMRSFVRPVPENC